MHVGDAELATVVSVLQRLVDAEGAPSAEYATPRLKPLRMALLPFVEEVRGKLFHGQNVEAYRRDKTSRRDRAVRQAAELARDRRTIDKTRLRAERLAKLKLLEAATGLARVPDGAVDDGAVPLLIAAGGALGAEADDGEGEGDGDGAEPTATAAPAGADASLRASARACYTCKTRYVALHHFYDQLCPACAALNFEKRHASAPLGGRIALVTGARVKIGFHICLKLLRAGARVVATTRFPRDAALRFAAAPDFGEWSTRLQVVGIDLRDLAAVERLCAQLSARLPRLDVLINNACQTVRRPPAFYAHLIGTELAPAAALPAAVLPLLASNEMAADGRHLHRVRGLHAAVPVLEPPRDGGYDDDGDGGGSDGDSGGGGARAERELVDGGDAEQCSALPSAALSQVALIDGDDAQLGDVPIDGSAGTCAFPRGVADVNGQQLDLRARNSWLLRLDEVSTMEAAEVLAINALAPFVLNAKLKHLLARTAATASVDTFIVNVSAMEGKFYRQKTAAHPHTNMAKAALNMMTRTSAADYAASRIYMTAVDTGWINDENPLEKALASARERHFQTPLDEIDAAARVLDPVFDGVNGGQPQCGVFLKDYRETEW
ncbi:hypothetical protein KFE25_001923 [Diacronema lutheri]|uniref:Oxidoreductase n=1 Tax=Diacronema lutheri TaxID=2081491 RepID=A0A8J5XKP6_DIALT|nr:hypothetical protein KFE25_001923 [Diacronema lutheri]